MLNVATYVALVKLGQVFLTAYQQAKPVDAPTVRQNLRFLIFAFCMRLFLYFLGLLITHIADIKLRNQLRRRIVEKLAGAPLAWFDTNNSGKVRKGVQDDTKMVHTLIAHGPVDRLNAIISPLSLMIYCFILDWRLGLLSVGTIPLFLLLYSWSMKGMGEKTVAMDNKLAEVSAHMVELVAGIKVVKAFAKVGETHENFKQAANDYADFYYDWCMPLVSRSSLAQSVVSTPLILLVCLGGGVLMIEAGIVSLPAVLVATLVALTLPSALITITKIVWSYQLAGSAAVRLCELLDTPQMSETSSPKTPAGCSVEINNVTYSYGETVALEDVSVYLPEGSVTALLGPSGSGKSTLAMLLARFADPDAGSIKIGGVDLRDMSFDQLYDHVSFVLQDAMLLHTSIRNNIALAKPTASLEEVRQVAQAAQIDDTIMALPAAYDTILGQDCELSGGEQQRVAIARAILADAPILIMDEATAFADPDSEAEIQRALSHLVKGRTVLVIAHRPGAIRGANQIVVMERGHIAARGRHEDLINNNHYRSVVAQSNR